MLREREENRKRGKRERRRDNNVYCRDPFGSRTPQNCAEFTEIYTSLLSSSTAINYLENRRLLILIEKDRVQSYFHRIFLFLFRL